MPEPIAHYDEPPLDEEPMATSLVPIEARLTMIDVDGAAAAYEAYLELCRRILDDNDYATIRGIKARKRSGWAKLRRFYGITTTITEQQRTPMFSQWLPGEPFVYRFTVCGRLGGRIEEADGACESTELLCPHCKGEGCQKCKGLGYGIAPTEHNVRAKALTRAKNRVTADLIGGGEVSAEELNGAAPAKPKKHWIERADARKKFWLWAHQTLGLTDDEVHEALGVESVKDYTGTMKEAKATIEQWLAEKIEEEQSE